MKQAVHSCWCKSIAHHQLASKYPKKTINVLVCVARLQVVHLHARPRFMLLLSSSNKPYSAALWRIDSMRTGEERCELVRQADQIVVK